MQTRYKLLRHLSDGDFHSGEDLAARFGISRAAVWKQLKSLGSELGLEIYSLPGKGYRLAHELELLEAQRIHELCSIRTRQRISRLHIHHSIDSTNSWLMQQANQAAAASGTVCLAERQTAGRGRHGRSWVSPYGSNIYLSLLWRFELAPVELAGLSLAAGLAVVRALRQAGCTEVGLKWPNDVLWRHRKLAGLLLEVAGEAAGPSHLVIGIGLNIRLGEAGDAIDQPWVDLTEILGPAGVSRNALVARLLENLLDVIEEYRRGGLAGFLDEWERHDLLIGRRVVVHNASRSFEGEHLGIDPSGGLRLQIAGEVRTFWAGEVSLRPAPDRQ